MILGSAHGGFCGFCAGSRRPASLGRGAGVCSRRAPLPRRLAASVAIPRPGSGEGDRADPGTPASEVCTSLQNLTTFLPRRTPLWSDILRATKLRSPPWTLVPTANNLLLLLGTHFSCCGIASHKPGLSDMWVTRMLSPACGFPHLETCWHLLHGTELLDSGFLTREGNPLNLKLIQPQFEV